MDYEMSISTNEHQYEDIGVYLYDNIINQNSQTTEEHGTPAKAEGKGGWRILRIFICIVGVVIIAGATAVTGFYSGQMLMTKIGHPGHTGQAIPHKKQNRTRVIPVCTDNLCNYRKDYETRQCSEKGYKIDTNIRFNRSSLYKDWFISKDNLMISNVQTPDTAHRSRGIGFKKYMGAMADRCVEPTEVLTFEVQYDFNISRTSTGHNLVFEIGVAELDEIDKYHYVGSSKVGGFSFNVDKFGNNTVLFAENSTSINIIYPEFSNITQGTAKSGAFWFLIDRIGNTFSILDHHQVLYTFSNVTSAVPLCPVFSVYNPHQVNSKLRLMHTTYMKLLK